MNEQLLREYVRKKIIDEGLLGLLAVGGVAAWLMSDDSQEAVADALEEMQGAADDALEAVQDMIDDFKSEDLGKAVSEAGANAVAVIQEAVNGALSSAQEEITAAIEGDEEIANEVPLGEAQRIASVAMIAAVSNIVKTLSAE